MEIKTSQYNDIGKHKSQLRNQSLWYWEMVDSWDKEHGKDIGNDLGILVNHKRGNCSTNHILGNHIGN